MTNQVEEKRVRELRTYHAGAAKVLHQGSPFCAIHAESAAICDELLELRQVVEQLREALLPMTQGTEWLTAEHIARAREALSRSRPSK